MRCIKSLVMIITVFFSLEGWAQGHGLCSNSAGFRKALYILEQDEDLSYIAEKIRTNSELDADEMDFFHVAYDTGVSEAAAKIKSATRLRFANNSGCLDYSLAMRYMLEDDLTAEQAVKRAISSRPLEVRTEPVGERFAYEVPISMILDGKENVRLNGVLLSGKTRRIIRELGREYFALKEDEAIYYELKKLLDPEQSALLGQEITKGTYTTYSTFKDMEVGEVRTLTYIYRPLLKEYGALDNRGHAVLVQRISPEKLILYNPSKSTVDLIPVLDQPWEFEDALNNTVMNVYKSDVRNIRRAYHALGDTLEAQQKRLVRIDSAIRVFEGNFGDLPEEIKNAIRTGNFNSDDFQLSSFELYGFLSVGGR